jgi:DNA repair exonuclease SbcCD ATPase subunit
MTKVQAQEFLEKHILGFDKNTYLASCYFSQEQLLTLANLGDAETTNMVTNLLGFETYDSLYVQMDLKKKEVTLQLELLEQSSVKLDNEIWKNSEQQKNLKEQIECSQRLECSLKDEQSAVAVQIGELTTLLGNIVTQNVTTEEIDVSLSTLNSAKSEMLDKLHKLQNNQHEIIQKQNQIDKEKIKVEAERKAIEKSIANHEVVLESLKENKCIYCGSILKGDELVKHYAEEKAEIILLRASIKDNTPELDNQLEKLYDQEAVNHDLIVATNAEIIKIENNIKVVQEQRNTTLKLYTEANSRKESLTQQIKQLEQRRLTLVNQVQNVNIDAKLMQLKELEENSIKFLSQKDTIICDKKVLNEKLDIYDFWHNTFSNKGIRTLLLDHFVNEFNSIVKKYCYQVSGGEFVVEFTPTSKIRSGLERNKLGLQVGYKDKIVNYAALSGGEKTRCNLPLCLGLNKWISQKNGLNNGIFGIMILDELFAHLDEKGRDNVAELLNEEGRNKSIFVIDHSDVLVSYTDNLWLITKTEDTTKLQVV